MPGPAARIDWLYRRRHHPLEQLFDCSNRRDSPGRHRGVLALSRRGPDDATTARDTRLAPRERRGDGAILWPPRRASDPQYTISRDRTLRRLLPIRSLGVWRRPCRVTFVEQGIRDPRLGEPGLLPCRLWRRAGLARALVHVRRVSWGRGRTLAAWACGGGTGNRRNLSARLFDPLGHDTVLGHLPAAYRRTSHHARGQRGSRWTARCLALQPFVG